MGKHSELCKSVLTKTTATNHDSLSTRPQWLERTRTPHLPNLQPSREEMVGALKLVMDYKGWKEERKNNYLKTVEKMSDSDVEWKYKNTWDKDGSALRALRNNTSIDEEKGKENYNAR